MGVQLASQGEAAAAIEASNGSSLTNARHATLRVPSNTASPNGGAQPLQAPAQIDSQGGGAAGQSARTIQQGTSLNDLLFGSRVAANSPAEVDRPSGAPNGANAGVATASFPMPTANMASVVTGPAPAFGGGSFNAGLPPRQDWGAAQAQQL